MQNPKIRNSVNTGNKFHYDKVNSKNNTVYGLSQLKKKYPETKFEFTKRGQKGADVKVTGGKHPSEYEGSTWQAGNDYGDFKPNTPSGNRTFKSEINNDKLPSNTQKLSYDPKKLKLID